MNMHKKKKIYRSVYVMVCLTPPEHRALKAHANGEPLSRTVRNIIIKKLGLPRD
jgi:hypothetical protein